MKEFLVDMSLDTATAIAHPNIALIKYWGDRDAELHIPANGSISMNLAGLHSRTTAAFSPDSSRDIVIINGQCASNEAQLRISKFLNRFRTAYGVGSFFRIESVNNFLANAGIASSASAFASLSLAVTTVCGLKLSEPELSRLARLGSGSACRSIPGGFVEWQAGTDHESSYAFSFAPPTHWDLLDCITIVNVNPKAISSLQGHCLAATSPLQTARVAHIEQHLCECRQAILERDFDLLARVVELDSNMMHAVMMTSDPPLMYWLPATVSIMQSVIGWRKKGLSVCYTVDAGANVHVLCETGVSTMIIESLHEIPGVLKVMETKIGGPVNIEIDI